MWYQPPPLYGARVWNLRCIAFPHALFLHTILLLTAARLHDALEVLSADFHKLGAWLLVRASTHTHTKQSQMTDPVVANAGGTGVLFVVVPFALCASDGSDSV